MKINLTKPTRLARGLSASLLLAAATLVPLKAATFTNDFNTDVVTSGVVTVAGSAKWVDTGGGTGYISLTDALNSLQGGMTVPDFDAGAEVGGFTANFKLQIGPGSGNAADGFSFNWGADVPASVGEEGGGTGLTVSFDIYDNGGGEAPAIDVKVGGAVIASKKMTKAEIMANPFTDVTIRYLNGLLDVNYKGLPVYSGLPITLAPIAAGSFTFGARTGGENAAQWIDNLGITTVPPGAPTLSTIRGNAKGLYVAIVDSTTSAVNPATVTATIDGVLVSGTATKTGDTTSFVFNNSGVYTAGSVHDVVLTYSHGTPPQVVSVSFPFTVGAYTTLPASAALASGVVDPAKRGFLFRVHQVDSLTALENTTARTENQLSGLLGDNVANPAEVGGAQAAAAPASPADMPISFIVTNVINFSDPTAGGAAGRFAPDAGIPGIPGTGVNTSDDSIAAEIITAVEFPAPGLYRLVVNSDDGFVTTAGKNPRDKGNPVLGFFEGGRGPTDSPFEVLIETAGVYPMRTIWEEGGGGAAIEIFSELQDGTRLLFNDTVTDARALKTYQLPASALPAYLGATIPAAGAGGLVRPNTIEAHLFDAGTTVTAGSITMKLNGATIPVTSTKTGGETTAVGTPPTGLNANTVYTVELTYSDDTGPHTVSWTFTAGPLGAGLFVIEAEDWDYSEDGVTGGLYNPQKGTAGLDVNVMPYYGGAYDTKSGVVFVDYLSDDPGNGAVYRTENRGSADGNDVSMYSNNNSPGGAAALPIASNDRGTYLTTVNYSHGWSGGDWFNYTREFPADNGKGGWYEVYIALSWGDGQAAGRHSATLDKVTSGVGTTTQTLERLGSFTGNGSGTWSRNNLVPMRTAAGAMAVVKLQGTNTLRASISSGDYDFMIFTPANPPPPGISGIPGDGVDSIKRDAVLQWILADGGSQVNASTVKLFVNNVDVTSQATVTKTDTGATVRLQPTALVLPLGEAIPWSLTFNDNAVQPQTISGSGFVMINPYPTPGTFVIEAEDFNYSADDITGGLTNPQKGVAGMDVDVMPYLGAAYNTLSAISGVDYNGDDDNASNVYRTEKDPNGENAVNITAADGNRYSNDRGTFTTTSNYRIGWVGGTDWQNYTRTFPVGEYTVWAALSFDGRGAGQLRGSLDLVTSDPKLPDQTIQTLGNFDAPGSGGWGRNELVPMKTNGVIAKINLGGVQTVRFNSPSGDFDYLIFVPQTTTPPGPKFTSIVRNANGSITVTWTGGGTLETTPVLGPGAVWTPVTGATSPLTFTPAAGTPTLFARIRQ